MRWTHAAVLLAGACLVSAPLYTHWDEWGIFDWDPKLMEAGLARRAILELGEIPLWNPYVGGGKPSLGDPLSLWASPFFALFLAFGELLGSRLTITLHLLLGAWLTRGLARELGASSEGSFLAAAIAFANGSMAWHLSYGHLEWISAAWIPGALLALLRAMRPGALVGVSVALGGACVAMIFMEGGVYLLPPTVLALLSMALVRSVERRSFRPAALASAILGAGFLLMAVKLFPVVETAHAHPRWLLGGRRALGFLSLVRPDAGIPTHLWEIFWRRTAEADQVVYRTDATCFVGLLATVLALAGAILCLRRTVLLLLPLAAILSLHLGALLPWDPWPLLASLGPMRMLRFPERFIEVGALLVGLLAAHGLDRIPSVWARRLLAIAVFGSLATFSWPLYHRAFTREPAPIERKPYAQIGWPLHSSYHTFLEGRGASRGYSVIPRDIVVRGQEEPGYRGEAFLRSGHGEARLVRVTANRFEVEVDAPGGLLVLNQNFDPGFRVEGAADAFVRSHESLLSAQVKRGRSRVVFSYAPPSFVLGLATTAIAAAGLYAYSLPSSRRRRSSSWASASSDSS